jgi:hypothetical protein
MATKKTKALTALRRRKTMLARVHPDNPGLLREAINPRTGDLWRLTDPEVAKDIEADINEMRKNPELATKFLQEVGILTKGGRLSRTFGGK